IQGEISVSGAAVRTVGLTKVFGSHVAADSVDLEIRTGEVLGFLGPNGAGKTTTINMILGLLQPTSGYVELFGEKADWTQSKMRRRIGTLLDGVELYPYLSAKENLQVFRKAFGGIPLCSVDKVLSAVGLSSRADDKVSGFSQGMKRRLGLALSLLPDPDILILDEPANGLDPKGIKDLRDLLKGLARAGKGVFLSSHLLHEVEVICDRVVILRKGKVIAEGKVNDLITETPTIELAVDRPQEAEKILLAKPEVSSVSRTGNRLTVQYNSCKTHAGTLLDTMPGLDNHERLAQLLNKSLASHGIFAYELILHSGSLEQVFFDVLKEVG
ncbi:MAG TPA: ATP-binding cassette domain-containing protein, partial [Bacillota bacterium]|nr:ATP-binding cassette domain-containing protein [Bacillota bacterium]